MKPESLGNKNIEAISMPVKSELDTASTNSKERESARCSNGVCEVQWRPSNPSTRHKRTAKLASCD
ncbi:MAG: hypothetical protein K8F91_20715 [Candidatus Obscuribacterales bacterium]|nr:hypothetical protein [Candidatus Obscuribacterales bacterium]